MNKILILLILIMFPFDALSGTSSCIKDFIDEPSYVNFTICRDHLGGINDPLEKETFFKSSFDDFSYTKRFTDLITSGNEYASEIYVCNNLDFVYVSSSWSQELRDDLYILFERNTEYALYLLKKYDLNFIFAYDGSKIKDVDDLIRLFEKRQQQVSKVDSTYLSNIKNEVLGHIKSKIAYLKDMKEQGENL